MTSNTTALVCTTASDPLLDMPVETLERKGLAHPDGICDALAEEVSVALSRYDLDQFGVLLHHNVDKVLLVSGQSRPAFGGGRVVFPYDLICAARLSESFMWQLKACLDMPS